MDSRSLTGPFFEVPFSGPVTRRHVAEITDGVVPELQRLGVVRTAYDYRHFRDNLLVF
jgi:hypothetical protein